MTEFPLMGQQGWQCPRCGNVMSPYTPVCLYCNTDHKTNATTSTSTTTSIWKFEDDSRTIPNIPNTGDGKFYDHLVK